MNTEKIPPPIDVERITYCIFHYICQDCVIMVSKLG